MSLHEAHPKDRPCMSAGCENCAVSFVKSNSQPYGGRFTADGIEILQMVIPVAKTFVPQHTHTYDHLSMLAKGSVKVWTDGLVVGIYIAPHGIVIKAGVKHLFQSLEDDTVIYCVHNTSRTGAIESVDDHHFQKEA